MRRRAWVVAVLIAAAVAGTALWLGRSAPPPRGRATLVFSGAYRPVAAAHYGRKVARPAPATAATELSGLAALAAPARSHRRPPGAGGSLPWRCAPLQQDAPAPHVILYEQGKPLGAVPTTGAALWPGTPWCPFPGGCAVNLNTPPESAAEEEREP